MSGERPVGRSLSAEAPELAAAGQPVVVPAGLVGDDEVVILMLRPSLLFIPLASLGSLAAIAVGTLLLAVFATHVSWVPWSEVHAYGLGATGALLRLGWQGLEWGNRLYVLTDRRVIRRTGVLRVSVFEARLRNIQHTSVFMLLRERICGLGSIGFATAGSDVFDAYWMMVRQPFAVHRTVVEAIRRYG